MRLAAQHSPAVSGYRLSEPGDRVERGPPRLQPGDRDAVGRAGHVVQPDAVEEVHRLRVAAMLAADPELQVGTGGAALRTAISTSRPTPSGSMVSNGEMPKMPMSR